MICYVLNYHLLFSLSLFNDQACFSGGMFALASVHAINGKSKHYMDIAKNITRTCHESYVQTGQSMKCTSTLLLIVINISSYLCHKVIVNVILCPS